MIQLYLFLETHCLLICIVCYWRFPTWWLVQMANTTNKAGIIHSWTSCSVTWAAVKTPPTYWHLRQIFLSPSNHTLNLQHSSVWTAALLLIRPSIIYHHLLFCRVAGEPIPANIGREVTLCKQWNNMRITIIFCPCYEADDRVLCSEGAAVSEAEHNFEPPTFIQTGPHWTGCVKEVSANHCTAVLTPANKTKSPNIKNPSFFVFLFVYGVNKQDTTC